MRELNVGSLTGALYELYQPEPDGLYTDEILKDAGPGLPPFLDLNGVFWSEMFSQTRVASLLKRVGQAAHPYEGRTAIERVAAARPDLLERRVQKARARLCDQGSPIRTFFGDLETLASVCKLYSIYDYAPHELTLYEGFLLDATSSLRLLSESLIRTQNPWLEFLERRAWPAILEVRPDCVWLNGRMSHATMAVARFVRANIPGAKIFWAGEASEYYAANKIADLLVFNEPLFSVLDGVILFEYEQTRKEILYRLDRGMNLEGVGNLIYVQSRQSGVPEICQGEYLCRGNQKAPQVVGRAPSDRAYRISPDLVANVHLFPDKICFWNRCHFCGINKKYPRKLFGVTEDGLWPVEEQLERLEGLELDGCRYIWSIDEAIPVETLCALADGLSARKSSLIWQARSRVSPKFLEDGVCQRLAAGGLRELRLGLESASRQVLSMMNKFDMHTFSLSLVEQIVASFQAVGVAVHFPLMIGFPTETEAERRATYRFTEYLHKKYDNVSFNINLLGLDISSELYREWQSFGITSVRFPCAPKYFLGNLLDWEPTFDEALLEHERDEQMRRCLYPWMPEGALVTPHVLYRLEETSRHTLTCPRARTQKDCTGESELCWNRDILVVQEENVIANEPVILYNMEEHCSITGGGYLAEWPVLLAEPHAAAEIADMLCQCGAFDLASAEYQIAYLAQHDFLIPVNEHGRGL